MVRCSTLQRVCWHAWKGSIYRKKLSTVQACCIVSRMRNGITRVSNISGRLTGSVKECFSSHYCRGFSSKSLENRQIHWIIDEIWLTLHITCMTSILTITWGYIEDLVCRIYSWLLICWTFLIFSNYVLEQTNSIDDTGKIRWQLVLCLLLSWMVVYFCMWKGVKSAGKVNISCWNCVLLWSRRQ